MPLSGSAEPRERSGPFPRLLPWLLLLGGLIGLTASAVLTVEKIAILRDPAYVPSCSINPVLSCGSVMTTPQAEAFGFPNPLLGGTGERWGELSDGCLNLGSCINFHGGRRGGSPYGRRRSTASGRRTCTTSCGG